MENNTNTAGEALDLNKLEALAKAATPGPWHITSDDRLMAGKETVIEGSAEGDGYFPHTADGQFVAAANPAAILELLALARRSLPVDAAGIKTWRERLLHGYEECDEREARDAEVADLRAALARAGLAAPTAAVEPNSADWNGLAEYLSKEMGIGNVWAAHYATVIWRKFVMEAMAAQKEGASEQDAWVSVEDRLPKGECLAVYVTPNGKQRLIRAKYARQFQIEAEGDDCETEYNEDDDTFYIKAGWLECIDNWGEYSSCYVVEGVVTHWKPSPALPAMSAAQAQPKGTTDTKEKA